MTTDSMAVDEHALRSSLSSELGAADSCSLEPLEGGNANETSLLQWDEQEFVVRRVPPAEPAPELLHDLDREYRVLDALEETWVPTPDVVTYCDDETVLGEEFYVMERLEGEVFDTQPPARFRSPETRQTVGEQTVDRLAQIHHIDADRVGLSDLGDPAGHTEQLVEKLTAQLEWAQQRTGETRELPVCFEVADWLADNVPPAPHATLVHGDYKLDNLLFGIPDAPRITGVLDWEMATRGDPLTDLGWVLSYWAEAEDPSPITDGIEAAYGDHEQFPVLEVFVEEYSAFMTHPEYHSRQELVDRYERQTGIEYDHDRFYRALGAFKLAALCEGFYRMYLEDAPNVKESYPAMELIVPALGRKARQIIEGEVPL
ncbi:phosphotransferase family protein [Salinirussus salinus]|uniref:phosphotransferase family protein n=1 Tax=Salinirussus salinus TaxID=1198300 RepID=UPI0013589C43|nr:phosphotransferase family protein [Salinirussus salinus]